MKQDKAQQAARDEKLVPSYDRVKIGKSNLRMDPSQFWLTIKKVKKSSFYQFDIDNKTCQIDVELFREILDICPRVQNQKFIVPPSSDSLLCLSGKTLSNDRLQPSRIGILWGIYHKANVDYVALIWEDLQYQIDNRRSKVRRQKIMPYPRFTKVIIHYFMSQHKSISRRQGSPYHTVDNDGVLDRLKFINKGDIYQVYGKPILDMLITDDIKNSEAYETFFGISTSLIPPKKGRDESEGEPENRPTGRKKRTPRVVVIQEPPSIPVKKTQESSGKVKGIKLLSDAAQLEIDTQRAIKASKCKSKFKHQTGGSSKRVGLRLEVPDELTGKSADSDEGAGTSPEVSDKSEDKSEARDDLDDWGSTDDEEYLLTYKDEKPEDIPWKSTNDDESENDGEEDESDDDKSIDIEKTDDERTDTDVEDQDDEELKADEEQKGDDQAGDEQLVKLFINSPSASRIGTIPENAKAKINSLLDIQIQQNVPNIQQEPFHVVKVYVIPETKQIPPTTPPAPLLPAIEIPSTHVSNFEAVKFVIQRFAELEKAVKELKQADHSTTILASIRSQVPLVVKEYLGSSLLDAFQKVLRSHTEELKKELSEKMDCKDVIKESVQANVINEVKNFLKKFLPQAVKEALEKTPPSLGQSSFQGQSAIPALYDAPTWSMLLDEANMKKGDKPDTVLKKRGRGDDQDEDPLSRSNQGKKTKKRRVNESESSKKTSITKESSKGKSPARTSKSVTIKESVEELVFKIALEDVEQTVDDKVGDSPKPTPYNLCIYKYK
ncbi:hypothetical protein Tco_1289547 [Tanacetum coccineum]